LKEILVREKNVWTQWKIQTQVFVLTAMQVVVNLMRGSPEYDSIIGISKCGTLSWSILIGFMVFLLFVTAWNVNEVEKE